MYISHRQDYRELQESKTPKNPAVETSSTNLSQTPQIAHSKPNESSGRKFEFTWPHPDRLPGCHRWMDRWLGMDG